MSLLSSGGLHTTNKLSSPTRRVTLTSSGRPNNPDCERLAATAGPVRVALGPSCCCPRDALLWRGRKGVTGGMGGRLRGLCEMCR